MRKSIMNIKVIWKKINPDGITRSTRIKRTGDRILNSGESLNGLEETIMIKTDLYLWEAWLQTADSTTNNFFKIEFI